MQLVSFADGLPNAKLLGSTKTVGNYVAPKGDSGADILSVSRGDGRHGNDCMLVTSLDEKHGLPGFWVLRGQGNGRGLVSNLANNNGYLAPDFRANRLSFWLRFDTGFRAKSSGTSQNNLVIGTYHFDPSKKGVRKESNNWHFYHQLIVRHDRAQDGWINVVVNEMPQHQRAMSNGFPTYNPTLPIGNYWDIATRFYVDCQPYFTPAEIPHPIRMFVDDIEFQYVAPPTDVDVELKAKSAEVQRGVTTTIPVEVVNKTQMPISGLIAHRSRYPWTPALVDPTTDKSIHKQRITLQPGTTSLLLQLTPRQAMTAGTSMATGVVFVPDSQLQPKNASFADPNVLVSDTYAVTGPCDCSPVHHSLVFTAV